MILRNLVSIAIRYTESSVVQVACRQRSASASAQAVVEVWDTSIRVAPENCAGVFKEFHQLENGFHLLVIDDDEVVLHGMAQLQNGGCIIATAGSIDAALDKAGQCPPQAIVSDFRLRSQQTGASAIAAVREQLGQKVPALVVTGDTAPERLR